MTRTLTLLALTAIAATGGAWFDTGHMVVGEVAYRKLTPSARQQVRLLLDAAKLDARTNDFRTATCWADDHKTQTDGVWHYINWFFREDGAPAKGRPLEQNVVWAIEKFQAELANRNATPEYRGKALVWLLHFVGDIHQPMHSVACESSETPNGDRGGNDFKLVSPDFIRPPVSNLHALWDSGGGLFSSVPRPLNDVGQRTIAGLADRAEKEFGSRNYGGYSAERSPEMWAKESFSLARDVAYKTPRNAVPNSYYLAKCQGISLWRVGLAGTRLADLINRALN